MNKPSPRVVSEAEFQDRIRTMLRHHVGRFGCVTGPGRSGAVAAVYASHILGVPFIPFGQKPLAALGPILIIDTAAESGKTLRKAARKYSYAGAVAMACYHEPPRVMFWYEAREPHRYIHELPRFREPWEEDLSLSPSTMELTK